MFERGIDRMGMKDLKGIIEGHTVSELAEVMFKELSNYHFTKLYKGMEQAASKIDSFDYEEKKEEKKLTLGSFAIGVPDFKIEVLAEKINELSVKDKKREKAAEMLEKELSDWIKLQCDATFIVDESNRKVKAIFRLLDTGEIYCVHEAICHPDDDFILEIGKLVAVYKASYNNWKERLEDAKLI